MSETEDHREVALHDGGAIPIIGFGTWQLRGREAYEAVRYALEVGYRHIDTAAAYGNESEVGRAVRESGLPREEIFITTKLPPENSGRERETMRESLRHLGVDQVDLWLIHWPPGGNSGVETWREFIKLNGEGRAAHIGVSNYSPAQVDELIEATGTAPSVNQIKWSPFTHEPKRLAHSVERGVVLEGYSPLKASRLGDPVLAEIAEAHEVSPAQVILRWHVEHEVVVIPRSSKRERISSNGDIFGFHLSPDEVARVDALTD
ncbi:MAG TPA: aldo/keto reductase [Candidatus Dormibacteraeota bacterium]|nr:aldo/keto reductase [Candidatus Dormibacteraeota bacterium]